MSKNQSLFDTFFRMGKIQEDGWIFSPNMTSDEASKIFLAFWSQNPKAMFQLRVRNFNWLNDEWSGQFSGTIMIFPAGLTLKVKKARIYVNNPNLVEIFDTKTLDLFKSLEGSKGEISAVDISKKGQKISNVSGRPFKLLHQIGGDPDYADYLEYTWFPPGDLRGALYKNGKFILSN